MKTSALLLFVCLLINNSSAQNTYTVEYIDAVKHIHNRVPKWGDEQRIKLEFIQKIGVLEGDDENYQLYTVTDVDEDSEGNIYVLELFNHRIQKFDPFGKYLSTIGRKGQGPGEFENSGRMEMVDNDLIHVANLHSKVQVLNTDGKYQRSYQIPSHFPNFRIQSTGNIVYQINNRIRPGDKIFNDKYLLGVIDKDENELFEFLEMKDHGIEEKNRSGNSLSLYLDKDDNVIVSFNYQNRIEKYTPDGKIIFSMDRPIDNRLTVKEEKVNIPNNDVSYMKYTFTLVSEGVVIDRNGRIWDLFYKKQKKKGDKLVDYLEFNIYDKDGIWLTTVPVPDKEFLKVENLKIIDDRLYLLDPFGLDSVYVYRIVEN